MTYEELLKACGLTQNESLVYLSLLKIGKATSSKIVKEAKQLRNFMRKILKRASRKTLLLVFFFI